MNSVNFDWGTGGPHVTLPSDNFSARWTGQVIPAFTETYTFYTQSDDGIRLWVNGQQLVNHWDQHGATEDSGTHLVNGRGAIRAGSWSTLSRRVRRRRSCCGRVLGKPSG